MLPLTSERNLTPTSTGESGRKVWGNRSPKIVPRWLAGVFVKLNVAGVETTSHRCGHTVAAGRVCLPSARAPQYRRYWYWNVIEFVEPNLAHRSARTEL
jgi:hypothetical protein